MRRLVNQQRVDTFRNLLKYFKLFSIEPGTCHGKILSCQCKGMSVGWKCVFVSHYPNSFILFPTLWPVSLISTVYVWIIVYITNEQVCHWTNKMSCSFSDGLYLQKFLYNSVLDGIQAAKFAL